MDGKARREELAETLANSRKPLSGGELAKRYGVSRQVIVQDIALLRATNKNIISTNKGYLIYDPQTSEYLAKRAVFVQHADEEIEDELNTIVDYGGTVLDVVISHEVYGQISVDLMLHNRKEVKEFVNKLHHAKSMPLKALTAGNHIHTVVANSEELLDIIESKLRDKGYLRPEHEW